MTFLVWVWVLWVFSIFIILTIREKKDTVPRDDSDPINGRSGLTVYTDYQTGLQYLGTPNGGFAPRLNRLGQHMRINDESKDQRNS
jgi:hypothetical protein